MCGIEQVEILARPANGIVGLTWRETRLLFGKPATADKRITEATEGESFRTRAQSGGFVFVSTVPLSELARRSCRTSPTSRRRLSGGR